MHVQVISKPSVQEVVKNHALSQTMGSETFLGKMCRHVYFAFSVGFLNFFFSLNCSKFHAVLQNTFKTLPSSKTRYQEFLFEKQKAKVLLNIL